MKAAERVRAECRGCGHVRIADAGFVLQCPNCGRIREVQTEPMEKGYLILLALLRDLPSERRTQG